MWGRKSCQSQVEYHAGSRSSREPWKVTMPPLNSSLKYFTKLLCWVALIKQSASESSLFRRLAKSHHFIMLGAPCCLFWEICLPGEWPVLPSLLDPDKSPRTRGKQFVQLFQSIGGRTKPCSIPQCQFALIKCNRENVAVVCYRENGKALWWNGKIVIGLGLSTES